MSNLGLRVGLWASIATLAAAITHSYLEDGYVIDAFDVPAELAAAGYTDRVIPRRILDEMLALQARSSSVREFGQASSGRREASVDVQVAGFGLSVDGVAARLRDATGRQARVFAGELTRSGDSLRLALRQNGVLLRRYASAQPDLDSAITVLAQAAAEGIYRVSEPYLYAILIEERDSASAKEALRIGRDLAYGENAGERPWGLNYLANERLSVGDTAAAEEFYREALAADENFYLGYQNLGVVLLNTDQPAEASAVLRRSVGRFEGEEASDLLSLQHAAARADSNGAEAARIERLLLAGTMTGEMFVNLASIRLSDEGYDAMAPLLDRMLVERPRDQAVMAYAPGFALLGERFDTAIIAMRYLPHYEALESAELLYQGWLAAGRDSIATATRLLAAARAAGVEQVVDPVVVDMAQLYVLQRAGDTEGVLAQTDSMLKRGEVDLDQLPGVDWYNETLEIYRSHRADSLVADAIDLPD